MIEWDYDHEEIEWWHSTKTINSDPSLRYQKYYKNNKFMENRKVIKNQLVQQKNSNKQIMHGDYLTFYHHCCMENITNNSTSL